MYTIHHRTVMTLFLLILQTLISSLLRSCQLEGRGSKITKPTIIQITTIGNISQPLLSLVFA